MSAGKLVQRRESGIVESDGQVSWRLVVVAFDSGPTSTGFAVLGVPDGAGRPDPVLLHRGEFPTFQGAPDVLRAALALPLAPGGRAVAAVETVASYIDRKRVKEIFRTAHAAGFLHGAALAMGLPVFGLPANAPRGRRSWRTFLTGQDRAGDADVKRAVELAVGRPVGAPWNTHVRDATGLGLVVARFEQSGRAAELALPKESA